MGVGKQPSYWECTGVAKQLTMPVSVMYLKCNCTDNRVKTNQILVNSVADKEKAFKMN